MRFPTPIKSCLSTFMYSIYIYICLGVYSVAKGKNPSGLAVVLGDASQADIKLSHK